MNFGDGVMARVWTIMTATAFVGLAAVASTAAHAQAFDDRPSTIKPIINMIVGGDEDAKGSIDFRERPPLVVPKGHDLPPPRPGAASQRAANWPQDQDVVQRRDDAARARAPQQIDFNKNVALDKRELMKGRSDDQPVAVSLCDTYVSGAPDCAPTSMDKLKRVFSLGNSNNDVVVVGKEPDRGYLTEPPRGYRRASQTVKATRDGGYEREDNGNAQKYMRDQAARNSDYR